jgi:4-aminobutyrate aminotransferase/(S)-3-amino-2-methylpropionate transaminase
MRSIELKTEIPGPRSRAVMERRGAAVPRGVFSATPVVIARGEGAILEDLDGNRFIDFAGGLGCLNIGHADSGVAEAVAAQARDFLHSCIHVTVNEPYVALAELLNQMTPGRFPKKTLLVNSGAEAVENAVKIARYATGRPAVICFENAFHGRTLLGMSLTGKVAPYKQGFGPFAGEVYRLPYGHCYRCPCNLTRPGCDTACADLVEQAFSTLVDARAVAAIIVEPVLGEGGFIPAPPEFLAKLRAACDRHGIVLIADEIQTGIGRTGTIFACEALGLVPDILLTAKSLGGGLPIAAVTGWAELMDAPQIGGLGGTFGGSPLACVAALAVLKKAVSEDLPGRARRIGRRVRTRMQRLSREVPEIGDVRGLGAMVGIELVDGERKTPAKELTATVQRLSYESGLITITAAGNVVRTLMPLVITDEQLDEGLDVLESSIRRAVMQKRSTP